MSIFSDYELSQLAHQAVKDAVDDLAHDQMGLGELLSGEFDERFDDLDETEQAVVSERLRAAIEAKRIS